MEQILSHLGWLTHLRGAGAQRRGPCPIHGRAEDRHRSFSVALDKQAFQCLHGPCAAQGNALDLWAAVHELPLYEAALHLAETFHLELIPNREEEPVIAPRKPR
jgi:DNA primase